MSNFTYRLKLIARHGVVSILCASIEYSTFIAIYEACRNLPVSYICSYGFAVAVGYIGHNYFTYKLKKISAVSIMKYIFQILTVLAVGYLLINFFVYVGLNLYVAKIMQLACTFGINLSLGRYLTFKRQ